MILSTLYLVVFTFIAATAKFSYEGYKVYQVTPTTLEEATVLSKLQYDTNYDFWTDIRALGVGVDIMVTPSAQSEFKSILETQNIEYSIIVDNVEELIRNVDGNQTRSARVASGEVSFTEFMRHEEILAYLDRLAEDYPDIVTTEVIGKSFEGRDLKVIKISSGGSDKPIIYIEAAIHAREWIAPPVALYIINQLVENADNSFMFADIDWIIFPLVNPDGYEYCHTGERLWRKTRTPGTICDGVDGNRNFEYQWMLVGASSWQCSDTYAGYRPFSEPETQAVRNIFLTYKGRIKVFLDLHSYGQLLLYPWGFTTEETPDNVEELHDVGTRVSEAIASVRGTTYSVGNSMDLLYAVGGGSRDYAKAIGEVDLPFTVELPAAEDATSGFIPDVSEIIPVILETWEGVKVFYEHVQDNYVP